MMFFLLGIGVVYIAARTMFEQDAKKWTMTFSFMFVIPYGMASGLLPFGFAALIVVIVSFFGWVTRAGRYSS